MLNSYEFEQTWTPMNPEGQQIIPELRSEVVQMKASAVPPNLTRDLEAKIESQKCEIQSLQRNLKRTQDSQNSWDEVNLNSIHGVCVDESSTLSVGRISDHKLVAWKPTTRPKAVGDHEQRVETE